MNYQLELASLDDIPAIYKLYENRIEWMDKKGIQQWNTCHYLDVFNKDYFKNEAKNKHLYALKKENQIIGAVVLLEQDNDWDHKDEAYYIHNLVSDSDEPGAGSLLIETIEQMAMKKGKDYVRLDCDITSEFLNSYYQQKGYDKAGIRIEENYTGNKREKRIKKKN